MKISKILSIVVVAVILLASASNVVLADGSGLLDPGSITPAYTDNTKISTLAGKIIGAIQTVGSVIAVVILAVIGIKYMMGSAEEKAEYKKTMVPYLVGAVLIFAASNIAGIIFSFTSNMGA